MSEQDGGAEGAEVSRPLPESGLPGSVRARLGDRELYPDKTFEELDSELCEALMEISRLRAENERLRADLTLARKLAGELTGA